MAQDVFNLAEWLKKQDLKGFPGIIDKDYISLFKAFEDYMFRRVHPEVEKLAMIVDGGYLNDHGPNHIKTVIERASQLLGKDHELSCHEVFLLLCAIHLHDVGNIFGRSNHESKLAKIVAKVSDLLGSDEVEIRIIQQIAKAHGGKDSEGENTDSIGELHELIEFKNTDVRLQFLSAILRFADELADDTDRASQIGLDLDQLPEDAKIFHVYAQKLHSVKVRRSERSINLRFNIGAENATEVFKKNGKDCLLLDEIFNRTLKMHRELIYCSRYMRDMVKIEEIDVCIDVYLDRTNLSPWKVIKFGARETGYPTYPTEISALSPAPVVNGSQLKIEIEAELTK